MATKILSILKNWISNFQACVCMKGPVDYSTALHKGEMPCFETPAHFAQGTNAGFDERGHCCLTWRDIEHSTTVAKNNIAYQKKI